MKGLAESSPFHLLTNPHMINRFIFGHGVVIYYIHCPFYVKNPGKAISYLIQSVCLAHETYVKRMISLFITYHWHSMANKSV